MFRQLKSEPTFDIFKYIFFLGWFTLVVFSNVPLKLKNGRGNTENFKIVVLTRFHSELTSFDITRMFLLTFHKIGSREVPCTAGCCPRPESPRLDQADHWLGHGRYSRIITRHKYWETTCSTGIEAYIFSRPTAFARGCSTIDLKNL